MAHENFKVTTIMADGVSLKSFDPAAHQKELLESPIKSSGSFGPFKWDVDFHIDTANISESYAYLKVAIYGYNIVDGRIDKNNPKITVDLTIAGIGVKGEVGIDFNARRIYFKGYLNFVFYKDEYDFTIFDF